ncbi:transcriptional regulator [Rubrivirga sp. S365]|uniref:Transcriptional regulator n=1 Tax=Rubrivirga litoralis TaxID=3075598 RepID=A0ABU3BQV3_9BACT|nr:MULTISPECIES: helix-turn-helix domain-containing protein [unclassified Rubrivirga]MDT0631566.1 transcriptional regulator [Rubrivirga sp. F394]MDT7857201.1 transcriptional regulator [Rubrivirga sp. S365]
MPVPHFPAGTKGELLLLMKRRGEVSLDDAQAATGLTRPTLRQHLGGLERDGLVVRSTQRQPRGRPSLRYALDPSAETLFPSRDGLLLGRLLDYLLDRGEDDMVRDFFERYWDERLRDVQARLRQVPAGDDAGRLAALGDVLREQGFMPEIRRNGSVTIRECNCPFPEAVKRTRLPCRLEAAFYERLFDDPIERVTYIPDGFAACTYEFAEPPEA